MLRHFFMALMVVGLVMMTEIGTNAQISRLSSPLTLQMPDASDLKPNEYNAVLDLKPRSLLVMVYAQWSDDKGAAQANKQLVRQLGQTDLYVRFHADPNLVAYSHRIGGAFRWGQLCATQMSRYYGDMDGVQLHAILANEIDARDEGGLSPHDSSVWLAEAIQGYRNIRPQDTLHVPATTGSPYTLNTYLEQYRADGWVRNDMWIDGHAYGGDLRDALAVMERNYPDNPHMLSEVNNTPLADAVKLVGRANAISYFTLNWAHGGEGRIHMTDMDQQQHISLMRWRDRYEEFRNTILDTTPSDEGEHDAS